MMTVNKVLIISLLIIIVCLISFSIYQNSLIPEVRFIRSEHLIYNYFGMKEAQRDFSDKKSKMEANLDSLTSRFNQTLEQYNLNVTKMDGNERKQMEIVLAKQENDAVKYRDAISKKIKDEEDQMTQGVLNQINSFIESYAKKKKFDVVLGTTASGNLLFGEEKLDITEEVLKELNTSYKNDQ